MHLQRHRELASQEIWGEAGKKLEAVEGRCGGGSILPLAKNPPHIAAAVDQGDDLNAFWTGAIDHEIRSEWEKQHGVLC